MVVEDGNFNDIFYAQKMRNLQFLSLKISNSAHPVPKNPMPLKRQQMAIFAGIW